MRRLLVGCAVVVSLLAAGRTAFAGPGPMAGVGPSLGLGIQTALSVARVFVGSGDRDGAKPRAALDAVAMKIRVIFRPNPQGRDRYA